MAIETKGGNEINLGHPFFRHRNTTTSFFCTVYQELRLIEAIHHSNVLGLHIIHTRTLNECPKQIDAHTFFNQFNNNSGHY